MRLTFKTMIHFKFWIDLGHLPNIYRRKNSFVLQNKKNDQFAIDWKVHHDLLLIIFLSLIIYWNIKLMLSDCLMPALWCSRSMLSQYSFKSTVLIQVMNVNESGLHRQKSWFHSLIAICFAENMRIVCLVTLLLHVSTKIN